MHILYPSPDIFVNTEIKLFYFRHFDNNKGHESKLLPFIFGLLQNKLFKVVWHINVSVKMLSALGGIKRLSVFDVFVLGVIKHASLTVEWCFS